MPKIVIDLDTVIHAETREALPLILDNSADIIITDPPYNMDKAVWDKGQIQPQDYIPQLARILRPGGAIYVCWSCMLLDKILPVFREHFNHHNVIAWHYRNGMAPTGRCQYTRTWEAIIYGTKGKTPVNISRDFDRYGSNSFDVWQIPVPQSNYKQEKKEHVCQKPQALATKMLMASSKEDDIVLDPFCGSGTFLAEAKLRKRRYIGIDSDIKSVVMAKRRLAKTMRLSQKW